MRPCQPTSTTRPSTTSTGTRAGPGREAEQSRQGARVGLDVVLDELAAFPLEVLAQLAGERAGRAAEELDAGVDGYRRLRDRGAPARGHEAANTSSITW